MSKKEVVGGVEGGASHSSVVIFDLSMNVLATVEGPGTNMFQIGNDETTRIIAGMVNEALEKAGMGKTKLKSLGMSLSGAEREESNAELVRVFERNFPDLSESFSVVSDTVGPLMTASAKGGVVLIAGTGSNSLLVNPDGKVARCGGWGHLVGDEGSACWVALRAVKTWYDHVDGKVVAEHDVREMEAAIKEYFGIGDRFDLLVHLYERWDKSHFAGLCRRLSESASKGDALCASLFEAAGAQLASHINALASSVSPDLVDKDNGLPVVCIGSVWKSWSLMEKGFMKELRRGGKKSSKVRLLTLKAPVAKGACYVGADKAKVPVVKDYGNNTVCFHQAEL